MRPSQNSGEKTYEELLEEAVSQIALYTEEWTDYNPSDPGITILENLTAFQALLRQSFYTVTDGCREKLLKLAGVIPRRQRVSRVLLEPPEDCCLQELAERETFLCEGACFETEGKMELPARLQAIYRGRPGQYQDISRNLLDEPHTSIEVFGGKPRAGDSIYFVTDCLPQNDCQTIYLYAVIKENFPRNPWKEAGNDWFAKTSWSVYAGKDGEGADIFQKISQVQDGTGAFLRSGEIALNLKGCHPARSWEFPRPGYVLRCRLEKAEYDIAPSVSQIRGFLFPVFQRNTLAWSTHYDAGQAVCLRPSSLQGQHLSVYGKEPGGDHYVLYQEKSGGYHWKTEADGSLRLALEGGSREIWVSGCRAEFLDDRKLGMLYGFEDQTFEIPCFHYIEEKSLLIMTEQEDPSGIMHYQFFPPGRQGGEELSYRYDVKKKQIRIVDPGNYEGAWAYLCGAAEFLGEAGNVRSENQFTLSADPQAGKFLNPAKGEGGRLQESIPEMQKRLRQTMQNTDCAVTPKDYESMARQTPGLCIHKAKAAFEPENNLVRLAVKPYGWEKLPTLSKQYQRMIGKYLETRRMLTVKIEIQGPVYVPINVHGILVVKRQYEQGEDLIRAVLEQELDFAAGGREFGETLYFNQVFQKIQKLPCVESIEELSFASARLQEVYIDGLDIRMKEQALCCPGKICLEMIRESDRSFGGASWEN